MAADSNRSLRSTPPRSLILTDNVPAGCVVSLAGINPLLSFASIFRDELEARGFGQPPAKEVRRARKRLD